MAAGCTATRPRPPATPVDYGPAIALLGKGDFAASADALAKLVAADPVPSSHAFYTLALAEANAGRIQEGRQHLSEALRLEHNRSRIPLHWHLELCLLRASGAGATPAARAAQSAMLEAAEREARALSKSAPVVGSGDELTNALDEMAAGRQAVARGDIIRGVSSYSTALRLWPASPQVKLCVSESLRLLNDTRTSSSILKASLDALLADADWRDAVVAAHLRVFESVQLRQ